jgi:ribosomal protein S18 acetylase RimI-like enzyme
VTPTDGTVILRRAEPGDHAAIADLHARSWQAAYRGILTEEFLSGEVHEDRRRVWERRLAAGIPDHLYVQLAWQGSLLIGFVCVFLDFDPEWGALVDNLHVAAESKRRGIGRELLAHAGRYVAAVRPNSPMHLWVFAENLNACRFYNRMGGTPVEHTLRAAPDGRMLPEFRYLWRNPAQAGSQACDAL